MSEPKLDEMTMRDLFALFAMQGIISVGKIADLETLASRAYQVATAMMEARNQ